MKQEKLPVWDLSALYKSVDDLKIKSDLAKNLVDAQRAAKKYRGRLAKMDNKQILVALKELETIGNLSSKLGNFGELVLSTDSQNPKNNVLNQQITDKLTEVGNLLIFFDLEIMELPEKRIKELVNDPILKNYRHHLAEVVKYKPHHLTESEEKIFNDKAVTGPMAFNRLFDQHFATRKFDVKLGKVVKTMTETEALNLTMNPDRETRKSAANAITKTLAEDKDMLTLIYNMIVKDAAINMRWHKFQKPEDPRHMVNEIDQKTVDAMAEAVQAGYGIVEDFYNFKKRVMGLPKLFVYDRYAPISKSDKTYSFAEAKKIILSSFTKFSKEFGSAAREFFDKKWIHAEVKIGKRGGAYCSYVTPDTHPVVFVNYQGKARDVQTLAHELGHGINAYMMRIQTPLNFNTPLTLAETASVFGEMLVFDDLKETIKDPKEKFALYVEKIQDIFATVFRQTSMYKFEQDFHALQKEKGELTTEEINTIWTKRQKEMFGNSVDISGSEQWWSYVPHFLHTPFYVYAYSFGELLVLSLYAQYKKDPKTFVPKYLELMSAGSSKSPQELLKPFGINLSDRKFWQGGINIIKELVVEAKQIYEQTKKRK
jgi:oligoendopeptidase F